MDEEMHKERLKSEPSMNELQDQIQDIRSQIQVLIDRDKRE
jgi:voltage-gated sodium channel